MGVALMVTEWGTVNANGDGDLAYDSVAEWMDFIAANQLSHAAWAVSNKDEGAAILKPHVTTISGWTEDDLTESGLFLRNLLREGVRP